MHYVSKISKGKHYQSSIKIDQFRTILAFLTHVVVNWSTQDIKNDIHNNFEKFKENINKALGELGRKRWEASM